MKLYNYCLHIFTIILLTIVYVVALLPIKMFLKAFGKRLLGTEKETKTDTYWEKMKITANDFIILFNKI